MQPMGGWAQSIGVAPAEAAATAEAAPVKRRRKKKEPRGEPTEADLAALDQTDWAVIKGEVDAVYVIYPSFKSILSAPPTAVQILPVQPPEAGAKQLDYILVPDAETILGALLPLYVRNAMYRALVEMTAAFYAAQRTAMKNATDNATDMLKVLGRTYNRARQASITQEIAEIVGGAAALQG